ncbi:MAG: xylan 1,4-beta-xylosidase, partial [Chloroflexota bacterium]|nr:xylan 1,4-beta-xylosidase [Chloroflexota bacterium]
MDAGVEVAARSAEVREAERTSAVDGQAADARSDWLERIGRRRTVESARELTVLPPPEMVRAEEGSGQVTLRWDPVPGAMGYLVHRAASADGPYLPLDHGGGDVLAVPGDVYVDTTGRSDRAAWYALASLATIEAPVGLLSRPVTATPTAGGASLAVVVDARRPGPRLERLWRPIIGAEHLGILAQGVGSHGRSVGAEFEEALRLAHLELGVAAVRAHGVLLDELGVYREVHGRPVYDFSRVDATYDRLRSLGLRPIVELSFMPHDLAADPDTTVFDYGAIVSPPRDWGRWEALVRELTGHIVGRYGIDEVSRHWAFEVWNEPNLEVFWSGTRADYLRLYDASARAVKSVEARLRVGGPATAAVGWVDAILEHVAESGAALDFLATHEYGNIPLDVRAAARRHGREDLPVWWTEWGVTPTHFAAVNDSVFGAPFICHSMKATQGRAEALAYWVISDHFEELGRPTRLFHGGFGLLSVGNLRKPRYWALAMLERLGDRTVSLELRGDGAGSLVDAWATREPSGRVAILLWNGTLDQSKTDGEAALDRLVELSIEGLSADSGHVLRHWRIDETHSNIVRTWQERGGGEWPDA